MARDWSDDLLVGVPSVDGQHKEIFSRVNRLVDSMRAGQAASEFPQLLDFLSKYVVTHFSTEEGLMARSRYPLIGEQKQAHAAFIRVLHDFQQQFAAKGAVTSLVLQFHRVATEWLVEHISKSDKQLGTFLRKQQAVGV